MPGLRQCLHLNTVSLEHTLQVAEISGEKGERELNSHLCDSYASGSPSLALPGGSGTLL